MERDELLAVEHLSVTSKTSHVIHDVSFRVPRGFVMGLFGPSGAGKSTTLLALAGLLDESLSCEGSIRLRGAEMTGLAPERRSSLGVALLLQDLALFPHLTVRQNVEYPLRRRGHSRKAVAETADSKMRTFHVQHLRKRYPGALSGGERQRVALARAIASEPALLLLDEPFRALDENLRDDFLGLVRLLSIEGVSVLLVTHEREDLYRVADGVLVMKNGRIVADSTLDFGGSPNGLPAAPLELRLERALDRATRAKRDEEWVAEDQRSGEGETHIAVIEERRLPDGAVVQLLRSSEGKFSWKEGPPGPIDRDGCRQPSQPRE